jgi:uncharacterized membrane protein
MADSKQAADVATYAAAVRAALAPLPESQREILLEDLEDHLAEVASESSVPLQERLGRPEDYAAELRSAYTGAAETTTRRKPIRDTVRALISSATGSNVFQEMHALFPELRPGWWVLRAYLAVLILTFVFSAGQNLRPIPNPFSSRGLLQILATLVAIVISVRLGRRGLPRGTGWRGAALVANVAIAIFALPVLVSMTTNHGYAYPIASPPHQYVTAVEAGYCSAGTFSNIYPYTRDGRPLKDILLYDQFGCPLTISLKYPAVITNYPIGEDGRRITNEYPLDQRRPNGDRIPAPWVALPPSSTTATASPTPTPTP